MEIIKEKGTGCKIYHPYCTVGAISTAEWEGGTLSEIDQDRCIECGVCLRSGVCPADALYMPELKWPRSIRAAFSNPLSRHPSDERGRGNQEMKTNEVTGRYRPGIAGIGVKLGRTVIGTTFKDLQKVSMALAKLEVEFEPNNPVADIMIDRKTVKINEDVLNDAPLFCLDNGEGLIYPAIMGCIIRG